MNKVSLKRENIFPSDWFPCSHASTIVQTPTESLLAAWFAGSSEGAADVAVWGAARERGGWSAPRELAREPGVPCYNPVLFYSRDGRLWLYYRFGPSPRTWTAARRWSTDGGIHWSPVEYLPAGLYGPIRVKPLVLDDGTILAGTSVESYRSWACWVEESCDHGRSWNKAGPICISSEWMSQRRGTRGSPALPEVPGSEEWAKIFGIIQPVLVPMEGRRVRLYARSTSLIGRICVADSLDCGRTWTAARPLELPNPNSGIDAVRLQDGRIVLVYNHSDRKRSPLNLAVSRDGETFTCFHVLEEGPGEFSYPAIIQGREGDLHITYTWKRKTIRYVRLPLEMVP